MAATKLTKRIVDAHTCPPSQARAVLFDSEVPGFLVEALRTGKKVYRFQWKRHGQQGRETIGEHGPFTVEKARGKALQLRAALSNGVNPAERRQLAAKERARAMTVAELVEKWLAEGSAAAPKKRASSWEADARKLRLHIVPLLGAKQARALTRQDIEKAQQDIKEGKTKRDLKTKLRGRSIVRGGEGIARSAIMSLSACYSWAISHDLAQENPVLKVKKSQPRKMERFLSEAEAARLFDTVSELEAAGELADGCGDIIRLLLLTGARKSEIQALEWREVNLEQGLIALPRERSKTGERVIILSPSALQILKQRRDAAETRSKITGALRNWVFPSPYTGRPFEGMQRAWQRVRARANLDDVRLHDLRHSFASFAAARGASLIHIGKALGHSQSQTTERYAHLTNDPLRRMVAEVERSIQSGTQEIKFTELK